MIPSRILIFVAGCAVTINALAQIPKDCPPQTKFGIDDPEFNVRCAIRLPATALRALSSDADIRRVVRTEGVGGVSAGWFTATYVELGAPGENDLLVLGNNAPLMGANVAPIWVLRPTGKEWHIILRDLPALGVEILSHKTNGYHDLLVSKATSNQAYLATLRFNGISYQVAEEHWSPIS